MNERGFQKAVKRVKESGSGEELASSVQAALSALLGQPEDRELLVSLTTQAETITNRLPKNASGKQLGEIRQAVVRCVLLLETAKKRRTGGEPPSFFSDTRVKIVIAVAALVAVFYAWLLAK